MRNHPIVRALLAFVLLVCLACATGCGKQSEPPAPSRAASGSPEPRALIVTANLGVTVNDAEASSKRIRDAVDSSGGYVSNSTMERGVANRIVRMELRVPRSHMRALHARIASQGELTTDDEKVEDATDVQANVGARLVSARTHEKRLLEIMGGKAGSMAELLELEKELARVRENIERLEGEERGLKNRVEFVTVHLMVSTRQSPSWHTPGRAIVGAWHDGLEGAAAIGTALGMVFVGSLPTLVPIGLMAFAIWWLLKRFRQVRRPRAHR
jgi:hypothetical protein